MDLTKKKVKINEHLEITLGRFLIFVFVLLFQILGILCVNNWVFTPSVFFTLSSSIFLFQKQSEKLTKDKKFEELQEKFNKLEEKINGKND